MSSPGPTAPATWLGLFLCGVHPAGLPDSVTAQGPGHLGRGRGLLGLVPRVVSRGRVRAVVSGLNPCLHPPVPEAGVTTVTP